MGKGGGEEEDCLTYRRKRKRKRKNQVGLQYEMKEIIEKTVLFIFALVNQPHLKKKKKKTTNTSKFEVCRQCISLAMIRVLEYQLIIN